MNTEATLGAFLRALQAARFRVGVTEVERLRAVFASDVSLSNQAPPDEPQQDDAEAARLRLARLRALLAAVIVKSRAERANFERLFDLWAERVAVTTEPHTPAVESTRARATAIEQRQPRPSMSRWGPPLVLAGLLLASSLSGPQSSGRTTAPSPAPTATAPPMPPPSMLPPHIRSFTSRVPTLRVTPAPMRWTGGPALALALAAAASTIGLALAARRRRWLPPPLPLPTSSGPPRVRLAEALAPAHDLLDRTDQEALVWGVGHFVTDEPTRRLDIRATVQQTARHAGIVQPQFLAARHAREVWLWCDEATPDSALRHLAAEVRRLLRSHGLPVETALFHGLPTRLVTSAGATFAPNELDERRDAALVAVLTDGRRLRHDLQASHLRAGAMALLRQLSLWPHLCFVDFSADLTLHSALVAADVPDVQVIAPSDLPAFLGADGTPTASAGAAVSEATGLAALWAGACALAPTDVAEATALRLRRALRLGASAWSLRSLRGEAACGKSHLRWPTALRARRVNRLHAADLQAQNDGLAPESLVARALDFWLAEYAREDDRQLASGRPWRGTPAEERLRAERALLRLWREPALAARELYALFRGALAAFIRSELGQFSPRDLQATGRVRLPWDWRSLPTTARAMLQQMGLAGGLQTVRLRQPGRVVLAVGLLAGVTMLADVRVWQASFEQKRGDPTITHTGTPDPDARIDFTPAPHQRQQAWRLDVSTRKWQEALEGITADNVTVAWLEKRKRCVEESQRNQADGLIATWRCGSLPALPAALAAIDRSVAVLVDPPSTPDGNALAAALLDSRTADIVYVTRSRSVTEDFATRLVPATVGANKPLRSQVLVFAPSHQSAGEPGGVQTSNEAAIAAATRNPATRAAWVEADDWSDLRAGLEQAALLGDAEQPIARVWPRARIRVLAGEATAIALGTGPRPPEPEQLAGARPMGYAFATVRLDSTGRVVERRALRAQGFSEDLGGGVTLDMVLVPAGSFVMGSPQGEAGRMDGEGPQRRVDVPSFYLGKFEVTQAQWRAIAAWPQVARSLSPDPSAFTGSDNPVERVSWNDSVEFCARLSAMTGRQYRLPSEAEWEYAARAGTATPFAFGDTITPDIVNYDGEYPYAAAARGMYRGRTTRVGELAVANAFGLFDMHGNVWEWVQDTWHDNYTDRPATAQAWESGDSRLRVLRGGSWVNLARYCRSAYRRRHGPVERYDYVGFRVLCSVARTR